MKPSQNKDFGSRSPAKTQRDKKAGPSFNEESIPQYKKAIRRQNICLYSLGLSYGMTGLYEETITCVKKQFVKRPILIEPVL
jgi:hypothetical protein